MTQTYLPQEVADFIIANHTTMTRPEMATALDIAPHNLKYRLKLLAEQGLIDLAAIPDRRGKHGPNEAAHAFVRANLGRLTYAQMGEQLGVSRQRIGQIVQRVRESG